MGNRTPAYWSTRIMLAVGIAAVLFAGFGLLLEPESMGGGPRAVQNPFVLAAFFTMVGGLAWMIRIARGPRDEPPAWRYRDKTPAYWSTRVMLVAGFLATAAVLLLVGFMLEPCFGCGYPSMLGLPSNVLGAAVAVGLAVVGLLWMLRIFRGPRDEPPAWRYRDR
jgi:hypothetical protein